MSARNYDLPPSEDDIAKELRSGGVEGVYYRWLDKYGRSYLETMIAIVRGRSIRRWQGRS